MRLISLFLLALMGQIFALQAFEPHVDFLYMRGFIYAENPPQILPSRYREIFPNLWVDEDVDYATSPEGKVCIFGLVVDVSDAGTDLEKIACDLEDELKISEEAFHNREDDLCGRYAILYCTSKGKRRFLADATANRAVYHSQNGEILAGHAKLVAENIAGEKVPSQRAGPIFGDGGTFPGRFTPYQGVYALVPNTSIEIHSGKIHRFYPRKLLVQEETQKVLPHFKKCMTNAMKGIEKISEKKGIPLLISLTAGIDSRTTLAVAKKHLKEIPRCFTYVWITRDYLLAQKISKALNIQHDVIPSPSTFSNVKNLPKFFSTASKIPLSKELEAILRSNSYHAPTPQFALNQEIFNRYGSNKFIHIRSNAAEIGRDYLSNFAKRNRISNACIAKTLCQLFPGNQGHFPKKRFNLRLLNQAMDDYLKTTDLSGTKLMGHSLREIYHWESNIGRRVSQLSILDDVIFDTFIPYNARTMLDAMLKVSHRDKVEGKLQKETIATTSPDLLQWPINPTEIKP